MEEYLESVIKQFRYYKMLGEKSMKQLEGQQLFFMHNEDSNSIGIIVKHLWGNMLSRWTDFLITDGEKEWRNRDAEFENDIQSEKELWEKWEEGWAVLFKALTPLKTEDLNKVVYIRNQGHTVMEAINRQLAHYAYHVGQIVSTAKVLRNTPWQSLSVPKGGSAAFNQKKFSAPKQKGHFTDDFLDKQ